MKKIFVAVLAFLIYLVVAAPELADAAAGSWANASKDTSDMPSLSAFREIFVANGYDDDLNVDNSVVFFREDSYYFFYLLDSSYSLSRYSATRFFYLNFNYAAYVTFKISSGEFRFFPPTNSISLGFSYDKAQNGYVWGKLPSDGASYLGAVFDYPGASSQFDASLPYVSSCIGYDRVVSPSFNDFGGVTGYDTYYRFGVDAANLDYDGDYEIHVELKIAFPTSDLVLYLESLGYNPSNCTSIDIYNELKHYYTEIYDPSNYPNYHAFPVELLLDDVTVFAFNLSSDRLVGSPVHLPKYKKNSTYSFIFSLSELEALYPPNYSVWGFDDDRFQDWWPLLRNFISINEFCCYATSGTDEGRLYKADLCGFYDERFLSLDEVYTKSYYLSPVGNEDTDLDSDEVKGSVIQSEKELEKDYEYQDKQEEILNNQIAEAAGVESLGGSLLGLVKNLPSFTSGIKNACMALFMPLTLLPSEIRGLFYLTIALLCAIAIIKFIRG